MQYAAWAFFLALVIIGVFIFAPKPEDAKKTEEAAPEATSPKQEEEVRSDPEDNQPQ